MANSRTTQVVTAPTQAYAQADRRRALADAIQKRALAPRDMSGMQGADPYLSGLTQLGEALMARYANKGATQAEGEAESAARAGINRGIEQLAPSAPVIGQIDSIDGEDPTQLLPGAMYHNTPAREGMKAAMDNLPTQDARQVISQALVEKYKPVTLDPDKAAQRALTREQIAATREGQKLTIEQRAREAEMRSQDQRLAHEERAKAAESAAELRRELAKMSAETARYVADSRSEAAMAAQQQKTDAAAADAAKKENATKDFMANTAANVTDEIDKALNIVDNERGTTGFVGGLSQHIGGTDARTLKGHLDTIKSNLGFDRLQQMRDMSKTGGALGGIAVRELEMLQSTVSSLDQAQDKKALRQSLVKAKGHYDRWKKAFDGTLREFDTSADAEAAVAAGKLKIGDKVVIDGVSGTWQ